VPPSAETACAVLCSRLSGTVFGRVSHSAGGNRLRTVGCVVSARVLGRVLDGVRDGAELLDEPGPLLIGEQFEDRWISWLC
jgi:hypothetical protein